MVVRRSACVHMTCSKCDAEFCYKCGELYASGGYYHTCNGGDGDKYDADKNNNNYPYVGDYENDDDDLE